MRVLLWALALAIVATVAAVLARGNDGVLVLLVPPYRIDLSLNLAVLLVLVLVGVGLTIGRLLNRIAAFPAQVAAYRERRTELAAQRALRDALQALLEGRFLRAERAAQAAQAAPANAGIAALIGARAAHRMQEYDRREQWLDVAAGDPEVDAARLASAAEMWAESRENARSLDAIEEMQSAGGRHLHTLRIALTAQLQSGQWEEVVRSVRALEKRRALHPVAARKYKRIAWLNLLREHRHDGASLEALWARIPAADRTDPALAGDAARWLGAAGRARAAVQAVEAALGAQWDDNLLDVYAQLPESSARERIERLEEWLRRRPGDPVLLRCLGRVCLAAQLWGKARSTLEESQRLLPAADTVLALAQLAEAVGDTELASRQYREAARMLARQQAEAAERGRIERTRAALREFAL